MGRFDLFPKLLEHLRREVWKHAASVPRVVAIFEMHQDLDLTPPWVEESFNNENSKICKTIVLSRTRPPAILSVCRESRTLALTIYKAMDEGIRSKGGAFDIPVYVNPEVDCTYRGKQACRKGDAFRIRNKLGRDEDAPVAATRDLAVDLTAITRSNEEYYIRMLRGAYGVPGAPLMPDRIAKILPATRVEQIAECARNGVRRIMIVVGNDDDASEFSLTQLKTRDNMTPREKGALIEARRLKKALDEHWQKQSSDGPSFPPDISPPTIKVVTIKRNRLRNFKLLPKLPLELQDLVWQFALRVPRVLTLTNKSFEDDQFLVHNRAPPIASVCRRSRRVFERELWQDLPGRGNHLLAWYHPAFDTVRLEIFPGSDLRDYSKYQIKLVGIP